FDAVLEELGGGEVKVKDLAAELNGMGGSAGVGELRDPVGKVKQGQVELIDLETPAEEVEFERDLAKRTGIDGLIFDLMYNDRPLEEAAEFFPKAKLSELERKVLGEMSEEDLVADWDDRTTVAATLRKIVGRRMHAKTPKAFLNFVVGCLVREAARTWLDDWSMITLLRGSPFAFLKDANDVLGAEVVDDTMLVRYKEGDSSVTRSKRVRSGTAALVSLQHAVSAALETCGNTHWATDIDFVALATELNLGFIIAGNTWAQTSAVAKGFESSETLSAVASWQRARENCQREIQEIIDRCKSEGTQFIDDSFNPLENESTVLYVDKKKPGYDCTVDKPHGWKRPADLYHWTKEGSVVAQDGAQWSDVKQGSIGDCFAVAAFAAMAACRKSFLRQALVAYDMEVGVYGVMFCEEMHFTYEILDTLFGVKESGTLAYARSPNCRDELWVSMIEKAYFKHMTCLEMCDGGTSAETVFSFLGGVWGVYPITDTDFSHPSRYWKKINTGLENGEIMSSGFHKPSKGKYAHGESGPDGQCGEHGAGMGLVEGHAYSVLRSGEVDGHKLICFRNPWAKREALIKTKRFHSRAFCCKQSC
ncbi:Calpain-type cysteine protease ADL1 (Phytocalpain ADL1) (Protein ADAXIALIZED LEAF1) (Protein DEFECTIVE KERNEL 1) (OsDEK1) (Protein SHOOTLESS 3), partial [Durusdinium trenchii]